MRSRWWAGRAQTAWHWQEGEELGPLLWLLIEWPKAAPEPSKYYLYDLPEEFSRKRLVQIAGTGLDHFEGLSWTDWHHHVMLVMMAHLFLRLEQQRRSSKRTVDPTRSAA
jgi:hypothetical protein